MEEHHHALRTHTLAQQYQVAVEEEGPVQQEPTEELGSEVKREETFTLFNPFIEVIHIIRLTDHEDLDQGVFLAVGVWAFPTGNMNGRQEIMIFFG